ncbi:Beta-1,3-galactosyltransferase GALT1 [Linum perenne]
MKRWCGGVLIASLFMVLLLRYGFLKNPIGEGYLANSFANTTKSPREWIQNTFPPALQTPQNSSQAISTNAIVYNLFAWRNLSNVEKVSLDTWNLLEGLANGSQALPNGLDAIKEAVSAWNNLMTSVEEEKLSYANDSSSRRAKEKQCPHFLNKMNATVNHDTSFILRLPCGLTQGSSITIIGTPGGLLGNFHIELTGESLPGEPDPPIIYHYNVRLNGDKVTDDPVIVQNTWTVAHDWGDEERCPSPSPEKIKKGAILYLGTNSYLLLLLFCNFVSGAYVWFLVDELDQCNKVVGKNSTRIHGDGSRRSGMVQDGSKTRTYFPFKQGYVSVMTLRVGSEGIQTTVDGKHITSFAYRETLEPWLVSEVRISGDLKLISVLASGLPTIEDSEHSIDLEALKASPLSRKQTLDLFIGVFSNANNFKRRMAVRRTWMQYSAVHSGAVAVRFFVGLHKNQIVNEELWNEARTYGDVQLMPFVDYYNLITWKTLAICIFGTQVASAKYVMKTDDDAFVRVDEVLSSLKRVNVNHGLLYGLINSDSQPHRNPDSKWYISSEVIIYSEMTLIKPFQFNTISESTADLLLLLLEKEWQESKYPPWAHGPGYVVSQDIAKAVYKKYKEGHLKMFKLEDVAMGIWIAEMKNEGMNVRYEKEERVCNEGCRDGYIVAHYQTPREMLCLWQKIQDGNGAKCCRD